MKTHSRLIFISMIICMVIMLLSQHLGVLQARATPSDQNKVYIVYLNNQEQASIAQEVQSEYKPMLYRLSQSIQMSNLYGDSQAQRPSLATSDQEKYYANNLANDQQTTFENRETYNQTVNDLDLTLSKMRQEITDRSAITRQVSQNAVAQSVEDFGGEVIYRYDSINAMAVSISPTHLDSLTAQPYVAAVYEDQLMEAHMNVSAQTIGANTWWSNGYDGGIWDVVIMDSGVDDTHPALSTHTFLEKRCLSAADTWNSSLPGVDPTADDINGHGTHIAGTIASTNSTYQGVAFGLEHLLNGKAGFDKDGIDGGGSSMYWSDGMACTDWALTQVPSEAEADIINLSYGSIATSDDGGFERFWDAVVDQMYAVVAISAGNDGPVVSIHSPSIAYNVISVANVDDKNTSSRDDDVISNSSSRGPTPNGRKKPDLAAPGSSINSTNNNWEGSTSDFVNYWGTSMATPHVAGAATLLMDRGISNPMAIKALLINTAEDKGEPGWDSGYGWGYIDLNHLDFHPTDYFADSVKASPDFKLYAGPGYLDDLATLNWHRRAVYNDASYPSTYFSLTDLDLKLYDETNNSLIDSSISSIDNVEQVKVDNTYSSVVIKVDSWSTIYGSSSEDYVLATEENFVTKNGPALNVITTTVTGDLNGPPGTIINVSARVQNNGDLQAHNVWLYTTFSDGLTMNSGNTSNSLGNLGVGSSSNIYSWQFIKNSGATLQWIDLRAVSDSYGESFNNLLRLENNEEVYLPSVIKE